MCRTTSGHTLPDVDCTKIGLIERFIHTHESNVYETLGSVLAAATPKRVLPSSFGDSPETVGKRHRTTISTLGQNFIDSYTVAYMTMAGNAQGRKNLYQQILSAAMTRKEELTAANWTVDTITLRLKMSRTRHSSSAALVE